MGKQLTSSEKLNQSIERIETNIEYQKKIISEDYHNFLNSLKPAALLKYSVTQFKESAAFRKKTAVVLGGSIAIMIAKKIFDKKTSSRTKNIVGSVVKFGLTQFMKSPIRGNR